MPPVAAGAERPSAGPAQRGTPGLRTRRAVVAAAAAAALVTATVAVLPRLHFAYAVQKATEMLDCRFVPGFALRHAHKDVGLARAAAERAGLELPAADAGTQRASSDACRSCPLQAFGAAVRAAVLAPVSACAHALDAAWTCRIAIARQVAGAGKVAWQSHQRAAA
jgi:hypothetical protein